MMLIFDGLLPSDEGAAAIAKCIVPTKNAFGTANAQTRII